MHSILFVCLGNICRSPAAEAVFRGLIRNQGIEQDFAIASKAVSRGSLGYPPFSKMVMACERKGYIVNTERRAQLMVDEDFQKNDHILVADHVLLERLLLLCSEEYKDKLKLMTAYSSQFTNRDIPDPYIKKEDPAFDLVVMMLEDSMIGFLNHLQAHQKN